MKKRMVWIAVAIVVATVGAGLIYGLTRSTDVSPDIQASTITAERGDIIQIVSATGSLSPRASADLEFGKAGIIEEIVVEEGDLVEEGQILARLEDEEETLSLLRAENALEEALLELESAKISHSSKAVIQSKERKLKERELELKLKKKELENTVLKAPFSGIISKIYVEEGEVVSGQSVSASGAILKLIDKSRLFAEVTVDEVDISQVEPGQEVRVTLDAYPDEIFPGKVVYISPEATVSSGLVVIEVKVELEESPPKLKPGLTVSADIVVGEARNVIILPQEEVREIRGRHVVMIQEEQGSSPRMVEVGISDGTYVEIKRGLEEGEVILSFGLTPTIEMRRATQEERGMRPPGGMVPSPGVGRGLRELAPR
jgi:RND family efflux transporter MFP subunit